MGEGAAYLVVHKELGQHEQEAERPQTPGETRAWRRHGAGCCLGLPQASGLLDLTPARELCPAVTHSAPPARGPVTGPPTPSNALSRAGACERQLRVWTSGRAVPSQDTGPGCGAHGSSALLPAPTTL